MNSKIVGLTEEQKNSLSEGLEILYKSIKDD